MTKSKGGFYAVRAGHVPGIYHSWEECKAQVEGFRSAKYHKFVNEEDARAFIRGEDPSSAVASAQQSGTSPIKTPGASPFNSNATTAVLEDETGWQVVYCDGACKGNGRVGSVAGVGVWWGQHDPRNIAQRCPGDQTNNRAELIAIVRLLESMRDVPGPLLIKTDSQYSIKCFNLYLPNWLKSNWRKSNGEPVKNAPLIRYLSALLDERALMGHKVRLQYVQGHSGNVGNDGADRLANRGTVEPAMEDPDWDSMAEGVRAKSDKLSISRTRIEPLQVEAGGNIVISGPSLMPEQAKAAASYLRATASQPQAAAVREFKVPAVPPPKLNRTLDEQEIDLSLYEDCLTDSTPQLSPSPSPVPAGPQKKVVRPEDIDLSVYADDWDDLPVDENGDFK